MKLRIDRETLERVAAYHRQDLADLLAGLLSAECERVRQGDIGHSQGAMQAFEAGTLVREADTRDARGMIPDHRRASLERVYGGEA